MPTADAEKLKNDVDEALRLIEALERAKNPVPPVVKQILEAMKEGAEISISAEEASQHLAKFIKDLDRQCGIGSSTSMDEENDAWICLARREHTEGSLSYSSRLNFVLNPNNPKSLIAIHWSKKKRSGWACVWDEIRNGSPSGLYRKCFIPPESKGHLHRK